MATLFSHAHASAPRPQGAHTRCGAAARTHSLCVFFLFFFLQFARSSPFYNTGNGCETMIIIKMNIIIINNIINNTHTRTRTAVAAAVAAVLALLQL